jgi:hypothetical protein
MGSARAEGLLGDKAPRFKSRGGHQGLPWDQNPTIEFNLQR